MSDSLEDRARRGDADAQNRLGRRYEQGDGIDGNDALAVHWYTLAAAQGHSDAQNNLGKMYSAGRGVQQDPDAALRLYREAAEQEHEIAQFNLGNMYYRGVAGPTDLVEALRWYTRSAELGDDEAQANVGTMHLKGEGTAQDFARAMYWLTKSAGQGNPRAETAVHATRQEALARLESARSGPRRILYLRVFKGRADDGRFIALLALSTLHVGRLVVIGAEEAEAELREQLETTTDLPINRMVEYIVASDTTWRSIAVNEISRADCILVHPSRRGVDWPSWQPSKDEVTSVTDLYSDAVEDPATGSGLLRELGYVQSLRRTDCTVLLCEEDDYQELKRLARMASLAVGDTVLTTSGDKMRRGLSKSGVLNRALGSLEKMRAVVTFQLGAVSAPSAWLRLRLEATILQIAVENDAKARDINKQIGVGVSAEPRTLPPDEMPKVIAYTNVEDLLFIPFGEIKEVDLKQVRETLSDDARQRGCPYCHADLSAIFFYTEKNADDTIRGKCQRCGRRSTVDADMLMDM